MLKLKPLMDKIIMTENNKQVHEYGCLMLKLRIATWDKILRKINPKDLYDDGSGQYGLEHEPHVTVLYGFHSNLNLYLLKNECAKFEYPMVIGISGISIFENEDYDVVKYDIISPELHKLNAAVSKFPHTTSYPEYHPHATIAYVKKGMGAKYKDNFTPAVKIEADSFKYSFPNGESSAWSY